MGLFRRRRPRPPDGGASRAQRREEVDEARRHLEDFVRTRVGVEAYLEPATMFIPPTVLLVATSGEWTRRRIVNPGIVRRLAEGLRVPVYDVQLVGYPQRMRDWNAKVKRGHVPPVTGTRPEDLPPLTTDGDSDGR
ncbi:MAG: hypothetical protein QG622_1518 [Actinomycetota bacterium]|nr:hypothetical protein [Actinomycetota bacterium]